MKHLSVSRAQICLCWGLGSLLFCLPLTATARGKADSAVPLVQQQAFQLGYALQAPAAQTEEFLQAVKGLKTITDDVQGVSEVGKLAKQSETLRATEQRAYRQATQMLRAMGAPPALQTWAAGEEQKLAAPLVLSKEAKGFLQSDPNTATVLGTIDEAQTTATDAGSRMTGLVSWLKITDGSAAVWATALGGLTAGMHASVVADRGLFLSRTEPMKLQNAAPFGTPGPVLDALTSLSPSAGNLAGLIRLPASLIPPKELREPQSVLLNSYGARRLAEAIDKG